jgi:hypothetical protein
MKLVKYFYCLLKTVSYTTALYGVSLNDFL